MNYEYASDYKARLLDIDARRAFMLEEARKGLDSYAESFTRPWATEDFRATVSRLKDSAVKAIQRADALCGPVWAAEAVGDFNKAISLRASTGWHKALLNASDELTAYLIMESRYAVARERYAPASSHAPVSTT